MARVRLEFPLWIKGENTADGSSLSLAGTKNGDKNTIDLTRR